MALLEEFESTLKEVVRAKRLSSSKMQTLTELALKSIDNDTQLVSIMYRTHKSLPIANKVSSLYTFDSLARAARGKVTKHNLTGDINSVKGNCATFLLKIEGVLDGLFQDMTKPEIPEGKEKSRKILEIWTKANTFPTAVLTRLKDLVKDAEKESDKVVNPATIITDPRTANQSPPTTANPITTPTPPLHTPQVPTPQPSTSTSVDPAQTALLALLSKAANGGGIPNSQTQPNIAAGVQPQLDPAHLAILQQLAQANKLGNGNPGQAPHLPAQMFGQNVRPGPGLPPPGGGFNGPPHQNSPYRDDRGYGPPNRGDPRFGRYDNAGRGRGRDVGGGSYDDQRGGIRGNYRGGGGGGFRGRGRGYQDDRGDRDHFRDRDSGYRSPPPRSRRSRSRSPPGRYGGGGRREVKPYSPPHRPTMGPSTTAAAPSSQSTRDPRAVPSTVIAGPGLDEFGREIRPQSPDEQGPLLTKEDRAQPPAVPPSVPVVEKSVHTAAGSQIPSVTEQSTQPANTAANTNTSSTATAAIETEKSAGLDKFDMSTFNFTDPTSWEVLGKMWEVTYGWAPSTEQLMQFVMSGGVVASAAAAGLVPGGQNLYPQAGMGMGMGDVGMGMGDMSMGGMDMGAGMQQSWGYGGQQQPQQWGVGGQGRGGHSNRGGGYGRGGPRNGQNHMGGYNNNDMASDAIVLGGGEDDGEDQMAMDQTSPPSGEGGGGPGGRMQRVGDKWKFVRDGDGPS